MRVGPVRQRVLACFLNLFGRGFGHACMPYLAGVKALLEIGGRENAKRLKGAVVVGSIQYLVLAVSLLLFSPFVKKTKNWRKKCKTSEGGKCGECRASVTALFR